MDISGRIRFLKITSVISPIHRFSEEFIKIPIGFLTEVEQKSQSHLEQEKIIIQTTQLKWIKYINILEKYILKQNCFY